MRVSSSWNAFEVPQYSHLRVVVPGANESFAPQPVQGNVFTKADAASAAPPSFPSRRESSDWVPVCTRTHCGTGGGTAAKSDASSGTSPAFTHCAMPAFHTSVARVSWPDETWP